MYNITEPSVIVTETNRMWETDFTKIYIDGNGWIYFSAYIDLCSIKIKGYSITRMSRTEELINALDMSIFTEIPDLHITDLTLRSDNGSKLTFTRYERHLKTLRIKHDCIYPNTPEQDGHIESYFNENYTYLREFSSLDEFKNYIDWAVNGYNSVRTHPTMDYLTPDEFKERVKDDSQFKEEWISKQKRRFEKIELHE